MYAGIDIGGTAIKGLLADCYGKELCSARVDTPKKAKDIDQAIHKLIQTMSAAATISVHDIKAIGIGSPGPIDRKKGIILRAPNIRGFTNHPIVKNLERNTGVKVLLENDVTVALIGARWKEAGDKFRNWILVTLGTGIGGGLVIDNRIYTGIAGNAMEIGHMTIDFKGRKCGCGNRGCWERYASGTAMVEIAKSKLKNRKDSSIKSRIKHDTITPLMIYEEAVGGDATALSILDEYSNYLGIGMANLVNIFNPEAIFIGGGISRAYRLLIPVVKKVVRERALQGFKENVRYIPLKDPDKTPCFGAVKIAIDWADHNPV